MPVWGERLIHMFIVIIATSCLFPWWEATARHYIAAIIYLRHTLGYDTLCYHTLRYWCWYASYRWRCRASWLLRWYFDFLAATIAYDIYCRQRGMILLSLLRWALIRYELIRGAITFSIYERLRLPAKPLLFDDISYVVSPCAIAFSPYHIFRDNTPLRHVTLRHYAYAILRYANIERLSSSPLLPFRLRHAMLFISLMFSCFHYADIIGRALYAKACRPLPRRRLRQFLPPCHDGLRCHAA